MSISIEGKIEYLDLSFDIEDNNWQTWMNLPSIIKFNDKINWKIFGNPRDFEDINEEYIAKNKGFPINPSFDLIQDIKYLKLNDLKKEEFGFTHFLYSEIRTFNWKSIVQESESDWYKLFILIEKFMELKNLSAERIRIIAWYCW